MGTFKIKIPSEGTMNGIIDGSLLGYGIKCIYSVQVENLRTVLHAHCDAFSNTESKHGDHGGWEAPQGAPGQLMLLHNLLPGFNA